MGRAGCVVTIVAHRLPKKFVTRRADKLFLLHTQTPLFRLMPKMAFSNKGRHTVGKRCPESAKQGTEAGRGRFDQGPAMSVWQKKLVCGAPAAHVDAWGQKIHSPSSGLPKDLKGLKHNTVHRKFHLKPINMNGRCTSAGLVCKMWCSKAFSRFLSGCYFHHASSHTQNLKRESGE